MKKIATIYEDSKKEWRWNVKIKAFGKEIILADSSEGYVNALDCEEALQSVTNAKTRSDYTVIKKTLDGKEINLSFTPSNTYFDR